MSNIGCGNSHSVFLSVDGILYSCGKSTFGQLGLGDLKDTDIFQPTEIQFFSENKTSIKQISIGYFHNAALAEDGNIYTWEKVWVEMDNWVIILKHQILFLKKLILMNQT
jgi:alpha-tubulin suppressor-like RCC1 family protein